MKKYLGWTMASNMPEVYIHLSGEDVDESILRMNGVKSTKEPPEQVKKCPRCKTLNKHNADYCTNCWLPISTGAQEKEYLEKQILENVLQNLNNPNVVKALRALTEKTNR
jgi:uncharacterized paraquat-inducible protein A